MILISMDVGHTAETVDKYIGKIMVLLEAEKVGNLVDEVAKKT